MSLKRTSRGKCRHCGEDELDHCEFTPYVIPAGCVCDPEDWFDSDDIPVACSIFVVDTAPGYEDRCATCGHERPCHKSEGQA